MDTKFQKTSFGNRLKTMLGVDFRRMLTSPLFYLMLGISLVMPILILVMTTMMDGSVSTNPQTGEQTVIEGFKNVWQIIGSKSDSNAAGMSMDITSMCNINMMFFIFAVFVCIFVGDDFRSGYSKNLFAVRSKKTDYVASKTVACSFAGALMVIAFFVGALLGGKISGLSFALEGVTIFHVVMSVFAKVLLVGIFSSIYILASVIAKSKLWLSLVLSFGIGMLLFTMVPMITPLDSTFINVILCAVGGGLFSFGVGAGSNLILKKTSLV